MSNEVEPSDYGQPVGRDFLDKLLLGIIDAHPQPSSSSLAAGRLREQRLRAAREALLGKANVEGRPRDSDSAVLRWIGNQHHRDRSKKGLAVMANQPQSKARSIRQLVLEAVAEFGLTDSAGERLRKKLSDHGLQKWLYVAEFHEDVPEQLDMNLLQDVAEILGRRAISMNLDRVER